MKNFNVYKAKQSFNLLRNTGYDQLKVMEQELLDDVYDNGLSSELIDKIYSWMFTVNLAAQQRNLSFSEYSSLVRDIAKMMVTLDIY